MRQDQATVPMAFPAGHLVGKHLANGHRLPKEAAWPNSQEPGIHTPGYLPAGAHRIHIAAHTWSHTHKHRASPSAKLTNTSTQETPMKIDQLDDTWPRWFSQVTTRSLTEQVHTGADRQMADRTGFLPPWDPTFLFH